MASGGVNAAIEVDAFDQRVHGQHFEPVPLRLHDGRIVADADEQPVGRRRKLRLNARDELGFGEVGDGQFGVRP